MKIEQFSPSLFTVSMGYVNAYLIRGEGEWALVDTGIPGQGQKLLDAMKEKGFDEPIQHIILTQLHSDHTGSLHELRELTGARVYAHKEEAPAIEAGQTMRPCVPAPGLFKWLVNKVALRGGKPAFMKEGTPVDEPLKGGETLPVGPGLEVVHTPGHTRGHISLILKEEGGILIAGDAASGGKEPGYPMLFEDRELGMKTLKQFGLMMFEKAVFGHGKPIPSGASELFRKTFS